MNVLNTDHQTGNLHIAALRCRPNPVSRIAADGLAWIISEAA
jgi:hypothetical protein